VFQPSRDRDASASIRGYVYQIDRTIDRWLGLIAEQTLELERGEDIDLVGRLVLDDGTTTEARLLEQIKHRESSITLRTPAALEALANFYDHRLHNPQVDLRFCFLTNAVIGCARLNPFPNRIPGITLWEQVRNRQLGNAETIAAIDRIRRFLAKLTRPEGLAQGVWAAWKAYLANATGEQF
jgi:hypothetical protein